MEFIKGYIYNTIEEAQSACDLCTDYYSPLPEGYVWVDYCLGKSNGLDIIYIPSDESLNVVLGEPIEFEIDTDINFRIKI